MDLDENEEWYVFYKKLNRDRLTLVHDAAQSLFQTLHGTNHSTPEYVECVKIITERMMTQAKLRDWEAKGMRTDAYDEAVRAMDALAAIKDQ